MDSSKSGSGVRAQTVSASIVFAMSVISSLLLRVDTFLVIVNSILGLFFWGKFIMAMMYCQGWKVFNWKTTGGMPRNLFIFYVVVATILGLMGYTILTGDLGADQKNLVSFLITATTGMTGSYIAWFTGINKWMADGSKYDAIMEFKNNGDSKDVINQKIAKLENTGVVPISYTPYEIVQ